MFSDVAIPKANRRLITWFVAVIILIVALPIVAQLVFRPSFYIAALGVIPALALAFVFNHRVASLRRRCSCGEAKYVLMGLLGHSYCYRCSNCGNLLRLRD